MFKHPWVLLLMPVIGILAGLAWSQRYRRNATTGVPAQLPALRAKLRLRTPAGG